MLLPVSPSSSTSTADADDNSDTVGTTYHDMKLMLTRTRDWFKIRSDRGNDKKSREEIKHASAKQVI